MQIVNLPAYKALSISMEHSTFPGNTSKIEDLEKELLIAIKKNAKLGSTSLSLLIKIRNENPRKLLQELDSIFVNQGYKFSWTLTAGSATLELHWDHVSILETGYKIKHRFSKLSKKNKSKKVSKKKSK